MSGIHGLSGAECLLYFQLIGCLRLAGKDKRLNHTYASRLIQYCRHGIKI